MNTTTIPTLLDDNRLKTLTYLYHNEQPFKPFIKQVKPILNSDLIIEKEIITPLYNLKNEIINETNPEYSTDFLLELNLIISDIEKITLSSNSFQVSLSDIDNEEFRKTFNR